VRWVINHIEGKSGRIESDRLRFRDNSRRKGHSIDFDVVGGLENFEYQVGGCGKRALNNGGRLVGLLRHEYSPWMVSAKGRHALYHHIGIVEQLGFRRDRQVDQVKNIMTVLEGGEKSDFALLVEEGEWEGAEVPTWFRKILRNRFGQKRRRLSLTCVVFPWISEAGLVRGINEDPVACPCGIAGPNFHWLTRNMGVVLDGQYPGVANDHIPDVDFSSFPGHIRMRPLHPCELFAVRRQFGLCIEVFARQERVDNFGCSVYYDQRRDDFRRDIFSMIFKYRDQEMWVLWDGFKASIPEWFFACNFELEICYHDRKGRPCSLRKEGYSPGVTATGSLFSLISRR